MENMTKALEIAASVLIGVLILSLLVFGYNQIREQKKYWAEKWKSKPIIEI